MKRLLSPRAALVGLAIGLSPLAAEPSARADEPTAAQLSDQAYARYEAGDFPAAVAFYMKAYALNVDSRILFNVAQIYDRKVQDRDLALEYYRRYLKSTTTEVELVRKATERVAELQRQMDAPAKLPPPPPVAGAPAAAAPAPVAPIPSIAPPPVSPPADTGGSSQPYWLGYTVAGVLGAGAAVTGALALTSSSSLAKTSYTGSTVPSDLSGQSTRTRALGITTDALIGGAVLSLAVTLIVQLSAPRGAKAAKAASLRAPGTDLAWRF